MVGNWAVELSLGQVARLCLFSWSLIILILFNKNQAYGQDFSFDNSKSARGQYLFETSDLPGGASRAYTGFEGFDQPIIGSGRFARVGEFPFHVGVYYALEYICGGVLFDNYRILTSKACTKYGFIELSVRINDTNREIDDGELLFNVTGVERHPEANLAILFIRPNDPHLKIVQPIGLPYGRQVVEGPITVTGWGALSFEGPIFNHLRKSFIPVTPCKEQKYGYFCSSQAFDGPCQGDGGGPAFKYISGLRFQLAGIISGSNCNNTCNTPSCDNEFVNTSYFIEWIRRSL